MAFVTVASVNAMGERRRTVTRAMLRRGNTSSGAGRILFYSVKCVALCPIWVRIGNMFMTLKEGLGQYQQQKPY